MNTDRFEKKRNQITRNNGSTRLQSRFDRFSTKWRKWRGYRALITPLLVVAMYFAAKTFYGGKEAAQLQFLEVPSEQTETSDVSAELLKPVLTGDAYESAARLRESGALLMAISLSSFEEFRVNGRFPATSREILSGLQKRSLLPPGIEVKAGTINSAISKLKLSYRAEPFSFEILSLPVSSAGGLATLFRFPLPPTEANSVMYFEARGTAQLPAPFSVTEQITAAGWKIRHWRGEALPLNETAIRGLREHDEWLKDQDQSR